MMLNGDSRGNQEYVPGQEEEMVPVVRGKGVIVREVRAE